MAAFPERRRVRRAADRGGKAMAMTLVAGRGAELDGEELEASGQVTSSAIERDVSGSRTQG